MQPIIPRVGETWEVQPLTMLLKIIQTGIVLTVKNIHTERVVSIRWKTWHDLKKRKVK